MSTGVLALIVAGVAGVLLFFRLFRQGDETVAMPPGALPGAGAAGATGDPIETLIGQGRKIEAIKLYREGHAVGLREAKEAVEEIERRLRQR